MNIHSSTVTTKQFRTAFVCFTIFAVMLSFWPVIMILNFTDNPDRKFLSALAGIFFWIMIIATQTSVGGWLAWLCLAEYYLLGFLILTEE